MDPQLAAYLDLWACLRAAHHLYWTRHWMAKGTPFYGDHLLFERLYEARVEEIDGLAELIAGLYGADKLDPVASWAAAGEKVASLAAAPSPLAIVEAVLAAIEVATSASEEGRYPASVANYVSNIGTAHLSDLYLLTQRTVAGEVKV